MKFTEGYWEKNERANASYAMQAFTAEAIPGGVRGDHDQKYVGDGTEF